MAWVAGTFQPTNSSQPRSTGLFLSAWWLGSSISFGNVHHCRHMPPHSCSSSEVWIYSGSMSTASLRMLSNLCWWWELKISGVGASAMCSQAHPQTKRFGTPGLPSILLHHKIQLSSAALLSWMSKHIQYIQALKYRKHLFQEKVCLFI